MNKPAYIIVHHSDSPRDTTTISMIDAWHKGRGFPLSRSGYYIGYHKVISGNGIVFTIREDDEVGAHARTDDGMNLKSIGICLTGRFEDEIPSASQLASLQREIASIREQYKIPVDRVIYHGQVAETLCCGRNLITWLESHKRLISASSMATIKTTYVHADPGNAEVESAFKSANEKFLDITGGKFGIEVVGRLKADISIPDTKVISDVEVQSVLVGLAIPPETQWLVVFYKHTMVRAWISTAYIPGCPNVPICKFAIVGDLVTGIIFEAKHAAVQFYNANRDRATMPSISNEDEYNAPIEYVVLQLNQLMPYLSVFEKAPLATIKKMNRLLKETGDNKVWLVTPEGARFWILDPATRDAFKASGLQVEEGNHDLSQYNYGGAIGAFNTDDPFL